jgi:subtilisin family serine protease
VTKLLVILHQSFFHSQVQPDIIAPGANIIASNSQEANPTGFESDKRRFPFITMSGTSMAAPHVTGVVGLLKTLYPDWSPSAIKSAIMTTGKYDL